MPLPNSLQYMVEQMTGLSRNNILINSQSGTTLSTNGTQMIRFAFPSASIVDLRSFCLHSDVSVAGIPPTAGNQDGVQALIPSGGLRSMIGRCAYSCGGISLSNDVAPLDVVSRCKDNLERSTSKAFSDMRVMDAWTIKGKVNGDVADATWGQSRKCAATDLVGFASSAAPRYFDCSVCPQIFVQCTLASRHNIPVQWQAVGAANQWLALGTDGTAGQKTSQTGFSGTQCSFTASNVRATIDVLSISTGLYSQYLADMMQERGALVAPFRSINTYNADGNAAANVRGALSTANLHKITTVARITQVIPAGTYEGVAFPAQNAYTVQQPPVPQPNNIGNAFVQASHAFTSIGTQNFRYRINNSPFSLHDQDVLMAYVQSANGMDRLGDDQAGSLVTSFAGWLTSQYAACNRFSLDNQVARLSGLDLAAISGALSYTATGDGSTAAGYTRSYTMYTESTSRLMIGPGRSVSVIH